MPFVLKGADHFIKKVDTENGPMRPTLGKMVGVAKDATTEFPEIKR